MRHRVVGLLPPALLDGLRHLRDRRTPAYEFVPEGWRRANVAGSPIRGWNTRAVLEAELAKWPAFRAAIEGSSPLAAFHEARLPADVGVEDLGAHNLSMAYGYVLALAARGRSTVAVLDWGGGLGHGYVLGRALLPDVHIDYHCRDLPLLAAQGAALLPDVSFHDDDACLERSYDLVMSSGSLQYSEDWQRTLGGLVAATRDYLYVTRLPVVSGNTSFVVLQHASAAGYETEYLGWVLGRDELLPVARDLGMRLVREFVTGERLDARGAPSAAELRGFLFQPDPERSPRAERVPGDPPPAG